MAKALQTDNTMLLDMLEIRTIQSLMEAFAEANEIAAGVFTPDCMRVGEPVRHSDYCKLIYKTGKGHNGCEQCDRKHMPYEGKPMSPYECHAHLQDFSVPIVAKKKKRRVLIGAIFAGQLRLAPEITKDNIRKIKIIARRYRISQNKLVAAYAKIPYFDDKRVKRIQDLMYALAYTIGQVATGRYEQHRLTQLLSTPISPAGVVEIIREFMQADACSIFTEKFGESDRIYLLATSYAPLRIKIGSDYYERGEGLAGWVYKHGRTLNLKDMRNRKALHKIASDLRWKGKVRDVSRGSRYHSFIGVPIRAADGRTIGVIRAVRQRRGGFAEMQQETFETIAATATAIVERLTSSDRTKAMLKVAGQVSLEDGLERFVNSVIVEAARLFIPPADDVAVTRYLPESHEFEIMAAYKSREPYIRTRFPETEGIAGYMLKTREPYRENNLPSDEVRSYVEKIRACIAYPIEFGRKFFGILAVISSRPGVFSERDFGELKLLGEHVTQAFRNAQQYEEARETSDLHSAYLRSLDKIAGLPPPWAPRPLMWRTAEILMREVNFDVIRAFVRGEDSILRCEREWVRRGLSTRCRSSIGAVYAAQGSIGDNDKIPLKITVAPGKTVGLLEVARKDGGASFSILEEKYLGLVAELLSGRLRTEEEMAAAIGASVVASSHDLGHLVVTPRDKLDTLLGDGLPETTASGRVSDDLTFCLRRLNDALEWAKTSMLLTDYRRGDVPSRSEFKLRDFRSEFQEAMEPALARSRWSIRVQVPAETKVRIFIPGFRRIIRDLTYNAVEHGKEDVPLRARAALCKHSRGSRVEISISNGSDTFTPEMARELEERSRTPENMPLGPQYGVGTLLAAVIAKIHGDSLKVRARNSVVRFSFTVPAVLPKRARKGERDGGD